MNRSVWLPLIAASLVLVSGCTTTTGGKGGKDTAGMANAGMNLVTAATLSDAEVIELGKRTADSEDRQNRIAPANSKYAKRLQKLTASWKTVDGVKLDYKVYMKNEVNAFAVPNGSIRVYSGLMDKLTDDELRYVVAHEIGHVLQGHSKKAMQTAYATSAARQAAASSGNSAVAAISASELGALGEALINAQFSQSQENEADDYAVDFLAKNRLKTGGSVTALRKLEKLFGNDRSVFSSHPAPGERANRMAERIQAKK